MIVRSPMRTPVDHRGARGYGLGHYSGGATRSRTTHESVHVLDLAVFLPSVLAAGVLLAKRHPWGYVLTPIVLVAMAFLGLGIVSLMIVMAASGLDAAPAVGMVIATLALLESVVVIRFLRAIDQNANLQEVVRRALDERKVDQPTIAGSSL